MLAVKKSYDNPNGLRKQGDFRYTVKKGKHESERSLKLREIIEVYNNEYFAETLNIQNVHLTDHAFYRIKFRFNIYRWKQALKMVKDVLSNAVKIGTITSNDGRICVVYAYNKIAVYMSPNLKHIVSVNRFDHIKLEDVNELTKNNFKTVEEAIKGITKQFEEITAKEEQGLQEVLKQEKYHRETTKSYEGMLYLVPRRKRSEIKELITLENKKLKDMSNDFLELTYTKKQFAKSLISLLN